MKIKVNDNYIKVIEGENLLQAFIRNEISIPSICNGDGKCGKCKVQIIKNIIPITEKEESFLSTKEKREGIRLACMTKPISGMEIKIDTDEELNQKEKLLFKMESMNISCDVEKFYIEIYSPSLEYPKEVWNQIEEKLFSMGKEDIEIDLDILKDISTLTDRQIQGVTVTLYKNKIIHLEMNNRQREKFGLALDIGTTGVALALVDLNNGNIKRVISRENGQTRYGADVITRITYAMKGANEAFELKKSIIDTIEGLLESILKEESIHPYNIYKMVVVGNTCMQHLFLGLNISKLAVAPFVSSCKTALDIAAEEIKVCINPKGRVLIFPNIGGFVGGDTVGAILGSSKILDKANNLLIDIGTNCELFLKTQNKMFACSTAAGPAFEGWGITWGMRAKKGAIEGINFQSDEIEIKAIGNGIPKGICGSGLIQSICEMKRIGIIDRKGTFRRSDTMQSISKKITNRIRKGKGGLEFVLSFGEEQGKDIVINQKDIRQFQLAKSAIAAGIKAILKKGSISIDELDKIYVSGTFAMYLDIESCI